MQYKILHSIQEENGVGVMYGFEETKIQFKWKPVKDKEGIENAPMRMLGMTSVGFWQFVQQMNVYIMNIYKYLITTIFTNIL